MKVFLINAKKLILLSAIIISAVLFAGINTIISVSKDNSKDIPIYSVERADNKIALSFNCAWGDEDMDEILEILKKHNVKSTFFIVGEWAEKYPEALKKIHENGHEIGAHSYSHGHYKDMSYGEILSDMDKCDRVIEDIIKSDIYLVRGGYGEYSNDVLKACRDSERTYIQWSLDSIDYKAKSTDDILNRITPKVNAGDIILMHTGTDYTAKALDVLLQELLKSHTPVTVSELIYKENFTIDHSGRQISNESENKSK